MDEKEIEQRIDEILLKKARGEKLTRQEHKILAYGYYASDRRQWVRTRVWSYKQE